MATPAQHQLSRFGRRIPLAAAVLLVMLVPRVPAAPTASTVSNHDSAPERISAIEIVGNDRTREEIVRMYLALDTGMVFDSAGIAEAKERLMGTGAFTKVAILNIKKDGDLVLYVVLSEAPPLSLLDVGYGGYLYTQRYGRDESIWRLWSAYLAFPWKNFRGRLERLKLSIRFWEWRSISASWYKPILSTPYFLSVGAALADYPYEFQPWRRRTAAGLLSAGREIGGYTRVYVALRPYYNSVSYKGPKNPGKERTELAVYSGPVSSPSSLPPRTHDTSWTDTTRLTPDTVRITHWHGHRRWEEEQSTKRYGEVYAALGSRARNTNKTYPISKGWYIRGQVGGNIPLNPGPASYAYLQFDTDVRLYFPLPRKNHSLVTRLQGSFRNSEGGRFHRLVGGTESTVRGYGSGGLGLSINADNAAYATGEYRFPIWRTPSMPTPQLANMVVPFPEVYYRFDGCVFADAGLLWEDVDVEDLHSLDLRHPFESLQHETGWALGAGIRWLLFPVKRSICFDVTALRWNPYIDEPEVTFLRRTSSGKLKLRPPAWNLYIDFTY